MSVWQEYLDHGWQLCHIPPGTKGPRHEGWNAKGAPFDDTARGAGLCHAYSGTCALDIDDLERSIAYMRERGFDLEALLAAPESVQIVSGKANRAKLLFRLASPLPSQNFCPWIGKDKNGKDITYHAFELRCANRNGTTVQDVLPPTMHPETCKPYEWRYGDDLTGMWQNLPTLPAALEALWRESAAPAVAASAKAELQAGAEHVEMATLLAGLDPNMPYPEWYKVGMAVHHETKGSNAGFNLWDAWSATGSKYKGSADLVPHWRSYKWDAKNPVTIGSLRRSAVAVASQFPIVPDAMSAEVESFKNLRPTTLAGVDRCVAFVHTGAQFVDLRTMTTLPNRDAVVTAFSPDLAMVEKPGKGKNAPPVEVKPNLNEFIQKHRSTENDALMLGMHPGKGRFYMDHGHRILNKFKFHPVQAIRPPLEAVKAFEFLWGRILDPNFRHWLKQFYAYAIRYPGEKIRSAPCLISTTTGTGKGTLCFTVPKLLFGTVKQYPEADLKSLHNGQLMESWWVTFDEIYAGNTPAERRSVIDKIKPWIANDEISIKAMHTTSVTIENHLQFTATSNHKNAIQLKDVYERHWGIGALKEEKLTNEEIITLFGAPGRPGGALGSPSSAGWLKHWLLETNMDGFNPAMMPPITQAKADMVKAGYGTWESRVVEAMQSQSAPFDKDLFTLDSLRDLLFGMSGPSKHALAAMLQESPFHCRQFTTERQRLYAWRPANFKLWNNIPQGQKLQHLETGVFPNPQWPWTRDIPEKIEESPVFSYTSYEPDPEDLR
jgi:hypothetical protein